MDTGSTTGEERSSSITQLFSSKDLLFLGLDERGESNNFEGRTDTIIIFHLSGQGNNETLISIPRDTRVHLDEK